MVMVVVRTGVTRPAELTAGVDTLVNNKIPIAGLVVFDEISAEPYYPAMNGDAGRASTPAAVS
jgi:hypothetical protein